MFGICTGRVVAQLANLPAGRVPYLVQVRQPGAEHRFGVAPDLHLTHARSDGRVGRSCFADEVAVFAQTVVAQHLHHRTALRRTHLQQHTQLLAEQGAQREFFAPRPDLAGPVLAVAIFASAVADAVALGHQQIYVECHTHMPGKRHLAGGGE